MNGPRAIKVLRPNVTAHPLLLHLSGRKRGKEHQGNGKRKEVSVHNQLASRRVLLNFTILAGAHVRFHTSCIPPVTHGNSGAVLHGDSATHGRCSVDVLLDDVLSNGGPGLLTLNIVNELSYAGRRHVIDDDVGIGGETSKKPVNP